MDIIIFPTEMIQLKIRKVKHKLVHNHTDSAAGLEPRWVWLSAVAVSEDHAVVRTFA